MLTGVNHRQRARRQDRRTDHARVRTVDRPAVVLSQKSYPDVKSAHIVPRLYQRPFAVNDRVAVHVDHQQVCVLMSTRKAGTRPRYYRRRRPDGQTIDDVEVSLAYTEDKAAAPLAELIAGKPITPERKGAVAQLLAVQMMRGPAFFAHRDDVLRPLLDELEEDDFTPVGLAAVGGDVAEGRSRAVIHAFATTQRFMSMLTRAPKMATLLAHMRWQILRFEGALLAYSDQPVVVWPMDVQTTSPFPRPGFAPMAALEIRVPIAPDAAILMTWVDRDDETAVALRAAAAGELNAFTIAQADRQWMHGPGTEPPVPTGIFAPISRLVEPGYDPAAMVRSARRAHAHDFLRRVARRTHVPHIEVVVDVGAGVSHAAA